MFVKPTFNELGGEEKAKTNLRGATKTNRTKPASRGGRNKSEPYARQMRGKGLIFIVG